MTYHANKTKTPSSFLLKTIAIYVVGFRVLKAAVTAHSRLEQCAVVKVD